MSELRTECCDVPIDYDERFCRKCGWEARVVEATAPGVRADKEKL